MADLQTFRQDTRGWLEENCPPSMRYSELRIQTEACWGGRNWAFNSEEQKQWLERMSCQGLDGSGLACRVRRWWFK